MLKIFRKRIFLFMAVIGLLVFFFNLNILKPVEGYISWLFSPILSRVHKASTGIQTEYKEQTNSLDLPKKVSDLENEINRLLVEKAEYETVKEENISLRESLRFFSDNELEYTMANVLARGDLSDVTRQIRTLIIDKGQKDGVEIGLVVVNGQGVVAGKVVSVKDRTALVYLTNNPKCKIAAAVLNDDRTSGIVEGELGLTLRLNFVPQAKEIKAGDLIITSGLEEAVPRGLVIGRVSQVEKESNELWQTAIVESLIDPDDLIVVSVLLPPSNSQR